MLNVPENISYPSHGRLFSLNSHPLWKFHFSAILSFKKIGLLKPPSPLEFLLAFLGVGMDIFWNYTMYTPDGLDNIFWWGWGGGIVTFFCC